MSEIKTEFFDLRPYTPKELRQLYGVSYKTFVKWLLPFKEQVGEALGGVYNVLQVRTIIDKLGFPDKLELK